MPDFIPSPDDQFNDFVTDFVAWVSGNGTTHGLTTGQVSALQASAAAWSYSWTGFQNVRTAFRAGTQDKDAKRAALEALIRPDAAIIQKNPTTTDEDRANAHITVPKGTRTPSTTPDTTPALQEADTSTRGIIRLFICDSTTPESRAKPANARCVEIREQIGGTAPVDPETMAFLAMESRMPYRADFDVPDIGKTVWLAFRWIGKNNQPGPWGQIVSELIPG